MTPNHSTGNLVVDFVNWSEENDPPEEIQYVKASRSVLARFTSWLIDKGEIFERIPKPPKSHAELVEEMYEKIAELIQSVTIERAVQMFCPESEFNEADWDAVTWYTDFRNRNLTIGNQLEATVAAELSLYLTTGATRIRIRTN